jgi:hypothetical protein
MRRKSGVRADGTPQGWQRRALARGLTDPAQAAELAVESVCRLNHLVERLQEAADVHTVLGSLATCLECMPLALEGLTAYLVSQQAVGRLRRGDGGDVLERVAAVGAATTGAHQAVSAAAGALRKAQVALSDVYGPVGEEGGDA